jgi:hypothetical protein
MKCGRSLYLGMLLVTSACDNGAIALGWEAAGSANAPQPLPWFGGPQYYERWANGFPSDPSFFPLGVWMQNPINAGRHQAVGINHYVGLWQGPTDEQLATAVTAGMPVFCEQAGVWQQNLTLATIQGWMHGATPDNAQENPDGSFGPCIAPEVMQAAYSEMVTADATRPVMLLLGRGVADPEWVGRGSCTGQVEDYPRYVESADLLTTYSYPLNNQQPLELVATGVTRLNAYAGYAKPIMADLEASNIFGSVRPTPHQLRAEVWLSLIHGAAGIQYFCHQMEPEAEFNETDCLDDPDTASAMTRINQEILALAPALNSQSYSVTALSSNAAIPVRAVLKMLGAERYVFAAGVANGATTASFSLSGIADPNNVEVIGEGRYLTPLNGAFEDAFEPYGVHLYRFSVNP